MFGSQGAIRIGVIGRHEIGLDPMAFGLFAVYVLFYSDPLAVGIAFLVAAFLGILVHELGHAFTIERLTGQATLVVIGFGGVTYSRGPHRPWRQFLISLAGPGAGFLLGGIAWAVSYGVAEGHGTWPWDFQTAGSIWLLFLHFLIWISLLWGVLNLLPIHPLDGGQALRSILLYRGMDALRARRLTRRLSVVLAGGAAVWAMTGGRNHVILVFLAGWIVLVNVQEGRAEGF